MNRLLLLAAISVSISIGPGCSDANHADTPPDRAACERYREHVLDVRLLGVVEERDAHRAALAASLGDGIVDECMQLDRAEVECATASATLEAARACGAK